MNEVEAVDISQVNESRNYAQDARDIRVQALYWSGGGFPVICGQLSMAENAAHIYSAMDVRGGGELKPFPFGANGCIVPGGMLGVNAAGRQTEAVLDFIRFALQSDVQKNTFDRNGMPVNALALEAVTTNNKPGERVGYMSIGFDDRPGYELESHWPEAAHMNAIIDMIKSATPIPPQEVTVRQMVFEEIDGMLSGDKTVDEAVNALSQKVERYMQE